MNYRKEHDSMGDVSVPADRYWGAQTQRSLENFPIGTEKMPVEIVRAFGLLKKAAALANRELRPSKDDRGKMRRHLRRLRRGGKRPTGCPLPSRRMADG